MNKLLNSNMFYFAFYALILFLLFSFAQVGIFDAVSGIRFVGILVLYFISFKRKKLSLWIFTSMLLGIEVGITFPVFGLEMERLGTIFLRLVKTLVAP
ncbi:MAG TPA: hypothetical protein VKZ44_00995, partial [Taishania sp.]|nr:hypothetical protein [Taishania sp.]